MNWFFVVRFLHIVSAFLFVGGIVARQLLRSSSEKTDNARNFVALGKAVGQIENFMIIPGILGVIGFGVILARITRTPSFGFLEGASRNWLVVSIVLLILSLLTVPVINALRGDKFDTTLMDAIAKDQMTAQLRSELNKTTIRLMYLAQLVLPVIILTLMIFKPF